MDIADLKFEAPGPGFWMADPEHTNRPLTALNMQATVDMMPGFRLGSARYGHLLDGMLHAFVHRFMYFQSRQLVARPPGDDAVAKQLFDEQIAANPEIQERIKRSDAALANKQWISDAAHWEAIGKPWLLGRTLQLTDIDPGTLTDEQLCTHTDQVLYHLGRTNEYHHLLNQIPASARGMLFMRLYQWANIEAREVEPLLIGSSPISAGDEPELRRLTRALSADTTAANLLASAGTAQEKLDALLLMDGEAGQACKAFVRMTGYRTIVGWEPMEPYALEQPELILKAIQHGLEGRYARVDEQAIANIRDRVPDANRNEFDELLSDARRLSCIRDERDLYCNVPVSGLLRRAVIEAGRRATSRGLLQDLEHMTEASSAEIRAMIIDGSGPSAAELADRYDYRFKYTVEDIPASFGEMDQAPVPLKWLPASNQVFLKMSMSQGSLMAPPEAVDTQSVFHGKGASPGTYEGTARVITDTTRLDVIKQGDVLITFATSPAFNLVFPTIGALVTQHGGLLSHAAIVAREFGLPAVIGVKNITANIKSGDRVRVDGSSGAVTLL